MSELVESLNYVAALWQQYVWCAAWQAAVLGIGLLAIVTLGRRWPSPVRYGLLVLALLKFATPPIAPLPCGVFSQVSVGQALPRVPPAAIAPFQPERTVWRSNSAPVAEPARVEAPPAIPSSPITPPSELLNPNPPEMPQCRQFEISSPAALPPSLNLSAYMMLTHFLGLMAMAACIAIQFLKLKHVRRSSDAVREGQVYDRFCSLSKRMRLSMTPELRVLKCPGPPVTFGAFRPTILLPQHVADGLPEAELESVLAHELAHHARGDLWVNWLQILLCAVWWFHPVVWLVNRALRVVREDCCDDLVVSRHFASNDTYCEALLRVAIRQGRNSTVAFSLLMADSRHPLTRRFSRIMDPTQRRTSRLSSSGVAGIVVMALVLLPGLKGSQVTAEKRDELLPTIALDLLNPASQNSGSQNRDKVQEAAQSASPDSEEPETDSQLTSESVLDAIEKGKKFLVSAQRKDSSRKNGSWIAPERENFPAGVTSLALLALINSGMTIDQDPVARGLTYLRNVEEPQNTYEVSLMIMVLTAAKDGPRDNARLVSLVKRLEDSQAKAGENAGSWSYAQRGAVVDFGGDRSNSQFAVLGLREAQHAGIPVSRRTWELVRDYWTSQKSADGGWAYSGKNNARSTGSMTVAGISTLLIAESMLRSTKDENPDGTPICCGQAAPDDALERGIAWLEREISVTHNPGGGSWLLYYLYGLERAGRLSGRRFFGQHDWYREGAEFLLKNQIKRRGSWKGVGALEDNEVIGTSLALLFLSKGLAPVLINKLKYGPRDPARPDRVAGDQWNVHPRDVHNLTELIGGLPEWPKLLTAQQVDIRLAVAHGGVQDLMQAPILFLNGSDDPAFSPEEIELLKEYVTQGGFILAEAACQKTGFDRGFRALVEKMYPQAEHKLKRLPPEHRIFRDEYVIDPDTTELWGVDIAGRTAIIYSPLDLGCLWNKWSPQDSPDRSMQLKAAIVKATRLGVNIVAYATGHPILNKLDQFERRVPAK